MKSKGSKNEKMTAIQFMKNYEETIAVIESIGDTTVEEQKVVLESANKLDYTDDAGVFKMESLMDVDIPVNDDAYQPQYYNSPVDELSDGDKSLIVDEFTNMLSKSHEEVIDFADVGPVATVIQNKFGFKQPLDDFLTELMTSAVDKQDSQGFAHGEEVPGMKGRSDEMAEEGGPADIEPTQVSPVAPPEDPAAIAMDAPMDLPLDAAPMGDDVISDEVIPPVDEIAPEGEEVAEDVIDDIAPEGDEVIDPVEEIAPEVDEIAPEVDDEIAPEEVAEEIAEIAPEGEVSDDLEVDEEDDEEKKIPVVEAAEETPVVETPVVEAAAEETPVVEAPEVTPVVEAEEPKAENSVEVQLESIKKEYDEKVSPETQLEASETKEEPVKSEVEIQLESIATEYHEKEDAKVEAVETEKKLDAKLEAITNEYKNGEQAKTEAVDAKSEAEQKLDTQLESITKNYKDGEQAKVEAIETDKKLNAKLESIANGYHEGEQAKVEAEETAKKTDEKIESLIESYHTSTKTAKVESTDTQKVTAKKIEEASKS